MMIIQPTRKSAQTPKNISPTQALFRKCPASALLDYLNKIQGMEFPKWHKNVIKQVFEQSFAILTWVRHLYRV